MTRTRRCRFALIAAGALTLCQGSVVAQTPGKVIKTMEHAEHGPYLVDGSGMSVYLFEEDRREGDRARAVESDCIDDCLDRWPPVSADVPPGAAPQASAALLGSFKRPDGKMQATYNGWPLYYFAEDFVPGDINGHDFEEFAGEWYLLSPAGEAAGQESDED